MSRQDTNSEDVRLSKSLSWVLRHGALSLGLDLSPDGYARVNDILALPQFKQFGRHDVERIVSNNSKKRFCLKIDIDGTPLIRANQGHSLAVPELELEEIKVS